jgi:ABC-type glycerol-3-phosphate transport system substrate-binding protein
VTGSGIAASARTENPKLAWAFIEHLVSFEVATKMIDERSLAWANTRALASPALQDDPMLGPMSAMVSDPASQSWTVLPGLGELCGIIMEHAQDFFLGNVSAQQALDEAAEEWNAVVTGG